MAIRRGLMMGNADLYPIGTDVITKYVGRGSNGLAYLYGGYNIGETTGNYGQTSDGSRAASPVYIKIKPTYRFRKGDEGRIYVLAYYDKDYNYISYIQSNNLNVVDLPAPPSNAEYMRYATHKSNSNWDLTITRIA